METTDTPQTAVLSSLTPDTALEQNVQYRAADDRTFLLFQSDGNLTISNVDGADIWGLHQVFRKGDGVIDYTRCQGNGRSARFEASGALVVRDQAGSVVWSSLAGGTGARLDLDASGRLVLTRADGTTAWASNGWRAYRKICDNQITILGSRATTNANLDAVAKVYSEMMTRLLLDKTKMNGFSIYMVNGEDWTVELASLSPINGLDWDGNSEGTVGNQETLRGGMCWNFCWIDERLICQSGPDGMYRSFDQVIHEFAHGVGERCPSVAGGKIWQEWGASVNPADTTPACGFAFGTQQWFGAPVGNLTPAMTTYLAGVFNGRATFACGTGVATPVAATPVVAPPVS